MYLRKNVEYEKISEKAKRRLLVEKANGIEYQC